MQTLQEKINSQENINKKTHDNAEIAQNLLQYQQ